MDAVSRHSLLQVTGLLPAQGYSSLLVTENGWGGFGPPGAEGIRSCWVVLALELERSVAILRN